MGNALAGQTTKLYTVFVDAGIQHFEAAKLASTTNEQLLQQLRDRCPGVEFIVRDLSKRAVTLDGIARELESAHDHFDGVVVFGGLNDYRPLLTDLPTLAVHNFPEFSHLPYALFEERGRVVAAMCDRGNICQPPSSEAMFRDLARKIGLLDALGKMKRGCLLAISDHPYVDPSHGDRNSMYPGDLRRKTPEEFNEILQAKISEVFGTRIIKIGTQEVASNEAVRNLDDEHARNIAQRWITEARGINGTIEREVVNSARMYLAIKALMREYGATAAATHIRSLIPNPKPEDMIWPSLGNSQLQLEGIVGCCQAHINVVLTHMLAQYAFGRPSMMGDFMVDVANGVGIVMHCGAPWNPRGGSDRIPYILRDHAERLIKEHGRPGVGACSEVLYPAGAAATVWRIDVPTRSILLHVGQTVDGYALYNEWDNMMCRTKLVVKLADAGKVRSHLYPDVYGVHRTGTFGDFREEARHIGRLIGFKVIEEDK